MCVLMLMILPGVRPLRSGTLLGGGVSERPKEHASKACEGATPPWVQIPPPPPTNQEGPDALSSGPSSLAGGSGSCRGCGGQRLPPPEHLASRAGATRLGNSNRPR